jgi:heme/copper-type cytochrome/quinol oxidase subunit 2
MKMEKNNIILVVIGLGVVVVVYYLYNQKQQQQSQPTAISTSENLLATIIPGGTGILAGLESLFGSGNGNSSN